MKTIPSEAFQEGGPPRGAFQGSPGASRRWFPAESSELPLTETCTGLEEGWSFSFSPQLSQTPQHSPIIHSTNIYPSPSNLPNPSLKPGDQNRQRIHIWLGKFYLMNCPRNKSMQITVSASKRKKKKQEYRFLTSKDGVHKSSGSFQWLWRVGLRVDL